MADIDEKDGEILDLLQDDCRMPLTRIARKVGMSIDSVKKRMTRMREDDVYHQKIQIRPRNIGFSNVVDIKMKLQYQKKEEFDEFVSYLVRHPRVAEIFTIAGEYDFSIVLIARDAIDLGNVSSEIRTRFGKMITAWNVSLTIKCYKFERYDMERLL